MEPIWAEFELAWRQWTQTLQPETFVKDAATAVHLVAMGLAIATVVEVDCRIMRSAQRGLTRRDAATLMRGHRRLIGCLATLWASGLALAWIATGGDASAANPKLVAKATVVVVLSTTALAMGRYAIPRIVAQSGAPLLALNRSTKLALATLGALSSIGWMSALALGAVQSIAPAPAPVLAALLAAGYAGSLAVGWTVAVAATPRPDTDAPEA